MPTFVAWLRGINVGKAGAGRKSVPMADLRDLAQRLGLDTPRTHVQSGNLVFGARGNTKTLADRLELAIRERFGFDVPVVVSAGKDLAAVAAACPFAAAVESEPNLVQIAFARRRPGKRTLADLAPYLTGGERCALGEDHLWAHFPAGIARTKLTPAVLDRTFGTPVTMRNARTLRAVLELVDG